MLMKKLPYIVVTLLIGILIGCGSTNPLVDEAKSHIEDQNPQAALESAEKAIQQYPQDPLGFYYKGVALGDLAGKKEDPEVRRDFYKRMNKAFEQAQEVASKTEDPPSEMERITSIKKVLWQTEHNRGVKMARNDSLKNTVENPLKYSVGHFKNATIVQPDSSLSWNTLASVASMNKDFEEAVKAKSQYIEMVPDTTLKPLDYRQLASFHYQLDNQQKVLETFQKGQEQFPEDQDIIKSLADTYNRLGKPDKAISVVKQLVEKDPENPRFHLVLGTQIYQKALKIRDKIASNSDKILQLQQELRDTNNETKTDKLKEQISSLKQNNDAHLSTMKELTKKAESELNATLKYDKDNDVAYNTLGVLYQNRAKALFEKRNRTTDNEKANKIDAKGKELLKKAMGYYEKAAEIKPENKDYWKSLFSIYTVLGMDKKAKEAMKKAGMQ
ncbi:tetratricopeptide repeat protein [Fodinibius halophilus]|uniref:Tetratricopeptide repeat protein n=1 Tax=Fodinibius halophilus TaxID=1736908 RepID=A0A6M1T390_9BACT|nr:tetratricopeptide repeat protein [Fodinibius halophilus]NGP88547.1 hypothetical protein [Fodinibius halophilus]